MKSFTTLRNLYGSITNNVETANLTLGEQLINDGIRYILGKQRAWKFLERSENFDTVAGQTDYVLPFDYGKLISIKSKEGNYYTTLTQVKSRNDWNTLTDVPYESNYLSHFYINDGTISFFPTPSVSGDDIVIYYKKITRDLANADYTTGTISVTAGSTTITGAGTTFTTAMVGRYIKVNADGFWYRIVGFTSTTVLTIENEYEGTTVAGAAFTIGEMSVLPENYDVAPVYYAASQYWYQNNDITRGTQYERMYNEKVKELENEYVNTTFAMGSADLEAFELLNPNDYPQNIT